jgi:hypothetical protein
MPPLVTGSPLIALSILAACFSGLGQSLVFAPAEGLTLTKTFTSRRNASMDEQSTIINGAKQDAGTLKRGQTMSQTTTVVLLDEYGRIEGGRPTTLKRTYETISAASNLRLSLPAAEDLDVKMVGESSLEGEVVLFSWNAEKGRHDIALANAKDSRESLLEGLTENTDLRGVLPGQEVAEGETWEVEPEILRGVLAFGGALKLDMKVDGGAYLEVANMGDSSTQATPDKYLGDLKGTVSAEYGGTSEHEGQRVAIIKLAIEVSTEKDMTEFFQESVPELPTGTDWSMDIHKASMAFQYKGNAIVLWGLDGGHMVALDMNVDTHASIEQEMSMLRPRREETVIESTSRYSGTLAITIRVDAPDRQAR